MIGTRILLIIYEQAWEDTFKNWDILTKQLQSYPKARVEEGQTNESFHRSAGKRRASHQSTEHELEVRHYFGVHF